MSITRRDFKACKKGDQKSQKRLYDAFKARVMGVCRRYSSCKEEAEDIFQEVFIKVFQKIDSVNELKYLERWILKTTVNTAINYYHKTRRHTGHTGLEKIIVFDNEDLNILDAISNDQLVELINELPEGYRLVFNLYVIEGYKHHEIAKLLHISENTSKSQLSRAKMLLRKQLRQLGILKYEKYG